MSDEELIAFLRTSTSASFNKIAADRIEALVAVRHNDALELLAANARAERLEAALREISAEASVTVHTWKNGINFKKMYEGWRKIAVERIDIARAALKGADHE